MPTKRDTTTPLTLLTQLRPNFAWTSKVSSRKDLEPVIGTRAGVSEILTGQRKLTVDMIRRLRSALGADLFSILKAEPTHC
jgi:antitoxin component HigA of HigAB toxin-antitoxin module